MKKNSLFKKISATALAALMALSSLHAQTLILTELHLKKAFFK